MKPRHLILAIFTVCITATFNHSVAQRLELDPIDNSNAIPEKIELEGTVVETRKYSFVVESAGKRFKIKIPAGVEPKLKLNKPYFNLEQNKLFVEHPESKTPEDRTAYSLPEQSFIRVKFNHQKQKERIMGAKTMRFNNYEISSKPFEELAPDEVGITGKLIKKSNKENWVYRNAQTEEFDILLGYQNATMSGFTIADLKPGITSVNISGTITGENIQATEIAFWPFATDESNKQTEK